MKRIAALIMILALALAPVALADTYEFEDFTLDIPADQPFQIAGKVDQGVYFTLSGKQPSASGLTPYLGVAWMDGFLDVNASDANDFAESLMTGTVEGMESEGMQAGNVQLVQSSVISMDGKDCHASLYSFQADFSGLGLDLQTEMCTAQFIVSDPAFGSYFFSVTAETVDDMYELVSILDSLKWNR